MSEIEQIDPLTLVIYTRSFSTMINGGVSLARTLALLEQLFQEPLRSATEQMRMDVCDRERTLSDAMRQRPDLFTPMYVAMVRAGEVGGVLDDALQQIADALEADWADWQTTGGEFRSLLMPGEREGPFADLPQDDKLQILSQCFRSLATMLSAGVPVVQSLRTAIDMLPPGPEHEALAAVVAPVKRGESLAPALRLPFLPLFAADLVRIAEETGTLDRMCEKIAQLLEYQRRYHLLKRQRDHRTD